MDSWIEDIARSERVERDARELVYLTQGDYDYLVALTVRRLGWGTNGRSAEVYDAAMAALHPELAKKEGQP